MKKKRGQLSVEWVTLIVFLSSLMIPAIYFLLQSFEDIKAEYDVARIDAYGSEIRENAERIYFSGLYSKTTLTPDLDGERVFVRTVFTASIWNNTAVQNYLVLNITTWQNTDQFFVYESDVPLRTDNCSRVDNLRYFPECDKIHYNCTICLLNHTEFLYRNLGIEALLYNETMYANLSYKR